jgi:hypothetical protein
VEEHEGGPGSSEIQTLHGVRLDVSREWSSGHCPLDNMKKLLSLELELEMHGATEQETNDLPALKAALGNMPLLGHLYLKGDNIPSCLLTDQSLPNLETIVVHGNVNWNRTVTEVNPDAGHHIRKDRPNLIQVKFQDTNDVPEIIKQQLGKILIKDD